MIIIMHIVHYLEYLQNTMLQKLDLFLSSGVRGKVLNPQVVGVNAF
jgi:hypothetical protein